MRLLLSVCLLAGCASTPSNSSTQAASSQAGFYVKALAGYGILEDADLDFLQGGSPVAPTEASFDAGPVYAFAAGYDFQNQWSVELEYAYRSNDLDEARAGSVVAGSDGDLASTSLMLNGLYRFDVDWSVAPYVGLGFGLAQEVDIDLRGGNSGGEGSYSTETPSAQFMLGATRRINEGVQLFAEGRFYRAFDPEMGRESGEANQGLRVETEYGHSALLLGVKFSL